MCVSPYAPTTNAPNWVAEHLGASSRRPRHPFSALMAGETPGRVPVYTALKRSASNSSTRHAPTQQGHRPPCQCTATRPPRGATVGAQMAPHRPAPVELHKQHSDPCLQLELEVVVVVGATNATTADPVLEHGDTPNIVWYRK